MKIKDTPVLMGWSKQIYINSFHFRSRGHKYGFHMGVVLTAEAFLFLPQRVAMLTRRGERKCKFWIPNKRLIGSDRIFGNQFSLCCIRQGHSTRDNSDSYRKPRLPYLYPFFFFGLKCHIVSAASFTCSGLQMTEMTEHLSVTPEQQQFISIG